MFTCDNCIKPIGPNISPVRVITATRPQTYTHFNDEDGQVVSQGSEIVAERSLCADCSGIAAPQKSETTNDFGRIEEKIATPAKFSMASVLVENLMNASLHNTKRGQSSFRAGFGILKKYEQRGGGM